MTARKDAAEKADEQAQATEPKQLEGDGRGLVVQPQDDSQDEEVEVAGHSREDAILLLEAAQKAGLPPEVVRTTSEGFRVPASVHKSALGNKK